MIHDMERTLYRIQLQPLGEEDAERMRVLRNRNSGSFLTHEEITPEGQASWFRRYLMKPGDYMFSAYHIKSGLWVGAAGLYAVDHTTGSAEFGRLIIDKAKCAEKGLGYDVTACACMIGFEQMDLTRIYLDVYADNIAAVKTYEKAGFHTFDEKAVEDGRKLLYMELYSPYKV